MKQFMVLSGGILFGIGLAVSGMTNPQKVIGFLDFFGSWDATLAFVMGGAVGAFGLGLVFLKRRSRTRKFPLPDTSADPICKPMLIGSGIFGIGWGLAGFCPGPAIANLGAGRIEAILFVPCMLVGMFIAQRVFGLDCK